MCPKPIIGVPGFPLVVLYIADFVQRTDSNGSVSLLADALGSVLGLTDSSGNVQTGYTYDPYGNTVNSGQSSANPSQFTGRENDGNGLYYYRARYYDSRRGRFISEDPARVGGNFYAYASDSPTNLVDPSGLGPFGAIADWLHSHLTTPPPPPGNFAPPKAPCICPGLDTFLNTVRQNAGPKANGTCATAVKTGLAAAGFDYWKCDALECGQGLLDRGFTEMPNGGFDLQPGDITVMQPTPELIANGKPFGHMAVWDGEQWISDYVQGDNKYFQVYQNTLKLLMTDWKYYRYPCSCSN